MKKMLIDKIGKLLDKIIKLIDLKSILTLSLLYAVIYMTLKGSVPDYILEIFKLVIYTYFGAQTQKNIDNKNS